MDNMNRIGETGKFLEMANFPTKEELLMHMDLCTMLMVIKFGKTLIKDGQEFALELAIINKRKEADNIAHRVSKMIKNYCTVEKAYKLKMN